MRSCVGRHEWVEFHAIGVVLADIRRWITKERESQHHCCALFEWYSLDQCHTDIAMLTLYDLRLGPAESRPGLDGSPRALAHAARVPPTLPTTTTEGCAH